MSDRPIIFSAPMIEALLTGRKSMTRRLVTPGTCEFGSITSRKLVKLFWEHADWSTKRTDRGFPDPYPDGEYKSGYLHVPCHDDYETVEKFCKVCSKWGWSGTAHRLYPRIQPGDLLWVKEVVACGACAGGPPAHWAPSFWRREQGTPKNRSGCWYRADGLTPDKTITDRGRWISSIHMPRWISRLTLEVSAVRIERLHDITEEDAKAEGLGPHENCGTWGRTPHKASFAELWCKLHKQSTWWAANPFVVAITFKVHACNIDALPVKAKAA